MNRSPRTPAQRIVPVALAAMVGFVALVLAFFGLAIVVWGGSEVGTVLWFVCIGGLVTAAVRSVRKRS